MKRILLISLLLFLILTLEVYIIAKFYYTYPRLNILFKKEYVNAYYAMLKFPANSQLPSFFEKKIREKYRIALKTHTYLTLEMFADILQDTHKEVLINICEIPNIDLKNIKDICITRILIRISIIMIFTILCILVIFQKVK